MNMSMKLRRFAGLQLTVTLLLATAGASANLNARAASDTERRFQPAPGLYQIERVVNMTQHGSSGKNESRTVTDPATGTESTTFRRTDGSRGTHSMPGNAPNQVCIKPAREVTLPPGGNIDGCTLLKAKVVGNTMFSSRSCGSTQMDLRFQKIEGKTWEKTFDITHYAQGQGTDVSNNRQAMTYMADMVAKNGTAEERAALAQHMKDLRASQAEEEKIKALAPKVPMSDLPPEVVAAMKGRGKTVTMTQKIEERMTLIGSCKG